MPPAVVDTPWCMRQERVMHMRCIILAILLCFATPSWGYVASVKGVHDGDSLSVRRSDKSVVTLRLYGIDAPELKQA